MKKKLQPVISELVKAIRAKLEKGEDLTTQEKELEVTRDEAAYLLSVVAGRPIDADYVRQLHRGDNPRLVPARPVGNTYMFTVDSLLKVRFTKAHDDANKEQTTENI